VEPVRHCVLGSVGPCTRRDSRLPVPVPWEWVRVRYLRRDRHDPAVVLALRLAGPASVTFRAGSKKAP